MPNIWFNGAHVSSTIGTETVRSSKLSTFKRQIERERERERESSLPPCGKVALCRMQRFPCKESEKCPNRTKKYINIKLSTK
jgi:hypothetical protein